MGSRKPSGITRRSTRRAGSLPEERRQSILAQVLVRPIVRADELADQLGVSIETVRRDLLALEQEGLTRRVYGGATRPATDRVEAPFEQRRVARLGAKRAMARLATSLIGTGSTLILDIGTSVAEIARQLPPTFNGRVITNSLLVATVLAGRTGIELLVAGGKVRGGDLACYGPHAERLFADFYGGTAFLGSGGVHPAIGLTDHYLDEIPARRTILEHADEIYVMADSSKLAAVAPVKVCDLSAVTAVITDDGVDSAVARSFEEAGVRLLVASAVTEADDAEGRL